MRSYESVFKLNPTCIVSKMSKSLKRQKIRTSRKREIQQKMKYTFWNVRVGSQEYLKVK
jgi:hypothetical protein